MPLPLYLACRDFVKMPTPWTDLLCCRRSRGLGGWRMTHQLFYSNPEKETETQLPHSHNHQFIQTLFAQRGFHNKPAQTPASDLGGLRSPARPTPPALLTLVHCSIAPSPSSFLCNLLIYHIHCSQLDFPYENEGPLRPRGLSLSVH